MLLVFLYSELPFAGVRLTELQTVVVGLILNGAAFFGEICPAGLESAPAGQREAGHSTGPSAWQVMAWMVIPQGIRNVVPPLTLSRTSGERVPSGTLVSPAGASCALLGFPGPAGVSTPRSGLGDGDRAGAVEPSPG